MKFNTYYQIIKWHIFSWIYIALRKEEKIKPYKMMVSITNLCNSRCKTCFIWQEGINKDSSIQEFSIDDIEKVFRLLGKNLIWLSFTGGEPVLKLEKIKSIIKLAKERCPNLSVIAFTTNGLIPNRALELAHIIRNNDLDSIITISLDGDEETHDYVRGVKGNYALTQITKKLLVEDNFHVNFGTTVSEFNYKDFLKNKIIVEKAKAITFAHDDGIYGKKNNLSFEVVEKAISSIIKSYRVEHLSEIIEYLYLRIARVFFKKKRTKNIIPCRSFYSTLDFTPEGMIKPCMFLEEEFKASDINENFFSQNNVKAVRKKVVTGDCSKCWMNCYAPHSIMFHPVRSLLRSLF